MKTVSKRLISLISLILALTFILSACAPASSDNNKNKNDNSSNSEQKVEYPEPTAKGSLPEVYITSADGQQITSREEYSEINIRFALSERYVQYYNSYTDKDGGKALLRCRGNSTYGNSPRYNNKYAYKLKLDTKTDLFGLGESKHWYLLNEIYDVTHMRNRLAYDMSGTLGMSYTASRWVVVYYNGEYKGIYSLVESLRVDEGRVETFDWEEYAEDIAGLAAIDLLIPPKVAEALKEKMKSDFSWMNTGSIHFKYEEGFEYGGIDIKETVWEKTIDLKKYFNPSELNYTTGYFIEYDGRLYGENAKWKTDHSIPVYIDAPDAAGTNPKMVNFVKTLVQDFENAIFSDTFFNSKGKHYSEYLDVQSLVDFWMVWNLFNNIEFGYLSLYYYIDNGKIVFGPCWDFDNASGNIVTLNDKWKRWDYWVDDRGGGWFTQVMGDPWFVSLCQERWFSMRPVLDDMMRTLDDYDAYLREEAIRCYEETGPRQNWYLSNVNKGYSYDYVTDFGVLKDWLTNRIKWIDTNIAKVGVNIDDSSFSRSSKIFYEISLGKNLLEKDLTTVYGTKADYAIPAGSKGTLNVSLSTTHTSAAAVAVYLNGSKLLDGERKAFNDDGPTVYKINCSELNLNPGDVNVLYIIAYNGSGGIRSFSSINIRAVSQKNPTEGEVVVVCGNKTAVVKEGTSVTLPDITESKEGFKILGWTTGDDKVYKPGDKVVINDDTYFYVRWQRLDLDNLMVL